MFIHRGVSWSVIYILAIKHRKLIRNLDKALLPAQLGKDRVSVLEVSPKFETLCVV